MSNFLKAHDIREISVYDINIEKSSEIRYVNMSIIVYSEIYNLVVSYSCSYILKAQVEHKQPLLKVYSLKQSLQIIY